MDLVSITTIIISIFSSSLFTLILSSPVFEPMREKNRFIFSEKQSLYISIILYAQIVLLPNEAKSFINTGDSTRQFLSKEEIITNALNYLQTAIPKLKLISKNEKVIIAIYNFIERKNHDALNQLANILRKDLYK